MKILKDIVNNTRFKDITIPSCILIISLLFSYANLFSTAETDSFELVIRFNKPVQPTTQNGVLFVNVKEFDDISILYQIDDFEFFDFAWSDIIHNLIVITLSDMTLSQAEEIFFEYEKIAEDQFVFIELLGAPRLLNQPLNFLYYDEAEPPMSYDPEIDVLGLIHESENVGWEIYDQFQYEDDNELVLNLVMLERLELLVPEGYETTSIAPQGYWDDYKWIIHGPLGMWHHTEMFNNTYNAWQYSTGEDVAIIISDLPVDTNHPGLTGRALPGFPHNHGNTEHGTMVTGVACASFATAEETTLLPTSSIGMAPEAYYAAVNPTVSRLFFLANEIRANQACNIKVLNMSWLSASYHHTVNDPPFTVSTTWDYILSTYTRPLDQGGLDIFVAAARGYNAPWGWMNYAPNHIYPYSLAFDFEGFMNVGALRSDWQVISYWREQQNGEFYHLNEDETYFRSSINAPGHLIWATAPYCSENNTYSLKFAGATSGASPQVAGAAALVRSRYPWMTAAQTERQITIGAKNLDLIIDANREPGSPVANYNVPDYFWGAGTLDALSALYLHGDFTETFEQTDPNETMLLGKEFELMYSSMNIQNGIVRIEKDAVVTFTSSELVIGDGVEIIFEGNSRLVIDQFSEITIGTGVIIEGYGEGNTLEVFGSGQEMIIENLTVSNCLLRLTKIDLTVNNSTLDYSGIHLTDGDLDLNDTAIDNSYGHSISVARALSVDLYEVNISNSGGNAIQITDVNQSIMIEDVNISGATRRGITISHSHPASRNFKISNCLIENADMEGVRLYNSTGLLVIDSMIRNNKIGFSVLNKSSLKLEDSIVKNNESQEIYYDYSSSLLFDNGYNQIYDNSYTFGEPGQYLVYRLEGVDSLDTVYMRNNYWGYLNQGGIAIEPPEYRFNPPCLTESYIISPLYTPGYHRQDSEETEEQTIFLTAMNEVEDENYGSAEVLLKELIEDHSDDAYATIAAKYLVFRLAGLTDNYTGVKSYLEGLDFENSLPDFANTILTLINYCDIFIQDYTTAISWFEDYIVDPHTQIDSVFAAIDLAYTYLLSQNSGRSNITLKNKEYAVRDVYEYNVLQSSLLDNFLFGYDDESEETVLPDNSYFVLKQSYPNPFYTGQSSRRGGVTISFSIPESSNVRLSVFNIKGQLVDTIISERLEEGFHQVVWSPNTGQGRRVASGIYFYKLEAGSHSQVKKMLIIK